MKELVGYYPETLPTKLGEALTIIGGHFADTVDNDRLLQMSLDSGFPLSEAESIQKAIAATGFTHRYFSHFPGSELSFDVAMERTADNGASLVSEVIKSHGWDGIDVLIDTSAFLPEDVNSRVLEKAGFNPDLVISKSYRYACAGAVGAFIDAVSDPELHNARVVIVALEPLSWLVDRDQFLSPAGIAFPAIFGDSYAAMAFNPGSFSFDNKKIVIQPDGGVIKLRSLYEFENTPSDPNSIPAYYEFSKGGREIFHYSSQGAYLNIQPPEGSQLVSMDGIATGMFFGDNTSRVITELIEENGNKNLLRNLDGKNLIMHPASKPVVDRIAKLMRRGGYLDTADIPFLMDKAKYSNGSSATTLNRFRYMIENNLIDPTKPFFWIAPGIGSAIAGGIGRINL